MPVKPFKVPSRYPFLEVFFRLLYPQLSRDQEKGSVGIRFFQFK